MWSSGQLQVHCQPLCGVIIGVRIRSLSWIGVSTLDGGWALNSMSTFSVENKQPRCLLFFELRKVGTPIHDSIRASPVTSCTCIREREVGSIRDAEADASKSATHAYIYEVRHYERKVGLSYSNRRLLHKSMLCKEGVSSWICFHPNLQFRVTNGPHSWTCICIADEKNRCRCGSKTTGLALRELVTWECKKHGVKSWMC
jgi:hypothetical protein